MQILGHFFVYLRPHDNMFTVLGVLGVLGFPNKNHSPLCVSLLFLLAISPGLTEDAECIRTDAIRYENTFLSDYKLPFALDR